MERLVESTKIVPICKVERKSKVDDNKGKVKYAAQNHSSANEWGMIQERCKWMYRETFKEKFSREGICKPVKELKNGKKGELILFSWQPLELPG